MNECENDDSDILRALLYSVFKKIGQFLFNTCLLTCLNKGTLVQLIVVNI